jgi:hypothetical protein
MSLDRIFTTAICAAIALPPSAVVVAQPAPSATEQNEWSKGVSEPSKATARALLEEGNVSFTNDRFKEALDNYQKALAAWDHPAIAFNAVRALVQLDTPVEAFDMLERSLRFGQAPLGPDVFKEAQNYKRLLSNLVATVDVSCSQPATVTLDNVVVNCPGKQTFRIKPGRHAVAASQRGFIAMNRLETLVAGANDTIDIKLQTVATGYETKTRWASWKPWLVFGAGAVVVSAGIGLEFSARSLNDDYAAAARERCPSSCTAEQLNTPNLTSLDSKWRTQHGAALVTLGVGGAVLAAGATLLLLNRPISVERKNPATALQWQLQVDPTSAGLSASGHF